MTSKVVVAALLLAVGALSGCVVEPARPVPYGQQDRDRDGVPNRYDRDRDGDRVPNQYDRAPSNPNRY